jgi:osmoprotectant transport system permease protein
MDEAGAVVITATSTSVGGLWAYLTGHWGGSSGIGDRLAQHLGYSVLALAIAAAISVPLGLYSGHTGRGGAVLGLISNASRALPTLGLLTIFAILIGVGLEAAIIPLVFIAVPAILVNTYVAITGIDRELVDAATGMGLSPRQVLWQVELPVGLPIIMLGFRTAALQVVSTATIAAAVGLGGLGRLIIDGNATRNFAELGAGSLSVAVFAILTEAIFLASQRLVVSPGLRRQK